MKAIATVTVDKLLACEKCPCCESLMFVFFSGYLGQRPIIGSIDFSSKTSALDKLARWYSGGEIEEAEYKQFCEVFESSELPRTLPDEVMVRLSRSHSDNPKHLEYLCAQVEALESRLRPQSKPGYLM